MGAYVYFGPYLRTGSPLQPGSSLRHATRIPGSPGLEDVDPGAQGVGQNPGGYRGVVYDCRNVYFVPFLVDYNSSQGLSQHHASLRHRQESSRALMRGALTIR